MKFDFDHEWKHFSEICIPAKANDAQRNAMKLAFTYGAATSIDAVLHAPEQLIEIGDAIAEHLSAYLDTIIK